MKLNETIFVVYELQQVFLSKCCSPVSGSYVYIYIYIYFKFEIEYICI